MLLYFSMDCFTLSCWSAGTMQMHVSMVLTGPPRHGKNGLRVGGACSASWSSTCFLAASFMPSCMPPSKDAIASRIKLEVSIARTLMLQNGYSQNNMTTWSVICRLHESAFATLCPEIQKMLYTILNAKVLYAIAIPLFMYVCDGLLAFQINNSICFSLNGKSKSTKSRRQDTN